MTNLQQYLVFGMILIAYLMTMFIIGTATRELRRRIDALSKRVEALEAPRKQYTIERTIEFAGRR